jgi:hypothetical protein
MLIKLLILDGEMLIIFKSKIEPTQVANGGSVFIKKIAKIAG